MSIPTKYTKEIESRLTKLCEQFDMSWYHDMGEGQHIEKVGDFYFIFYCLHSDISLDNINEQRSLLSSISNHKEGIEFYKVWNDRSWKKFTKFDRVSFSNKQCFKLNIQCVLNTLEFGKKDKISDMRKSFMSLLVMNFVPDKPTYLDLYRQNPWQNPYDLSGEW